VRQLGSERRRTQITAVRQNRAFDVLSNGVLLFVIFSAMASLIIGKGETLMDRAFEGEGLHWLVGECVLPFLAAVLSAFATHAGLRALLRRLRLRLSTDEYPASIVFLIVVGLFAVGATMLDWREGIERDWLTHLSVVMGAWAGVVLRRRIRL
jgi:hypothetical protein